MIDFDFYISNLISGYLTGILTREEEENLLQWRKEKIENEALFQHICALENQEAYQDKSVYFNENEGWKGFSRKLYIAQKRQFFVRILSYASLIIIPLLVVFTMNRINPPQLTNQYGHIEDASIHILPGESKAVLTLDNGEMIQLEAVGDKQLNEADGTPISVGGATLNYMADLSQGKENHSEMIYNKLQVPHGGEYLLKLIDGTKVHLNSLTSLRYPVRFQQSKERIVELDGEAYFEVAETNEPFIVKLNGMEVEVLGTTFNVSAYEDQLYQTTLIKGVVKVETEQGESHLLSPSQQASFSPEDGKIEVQTVDVREFTSWIEGKIYFKDQRLENIMNSLSRWYDMEIEYGNSAIRDLRFGCNVDRYEEITPFLDLLQKTGKVNISVNEKTILISPII